MEYQAFEDSLQHEEQRLKEMQGKKSERNRVESGEVRKLGGKK